MALNCANTIDISDYGSRFWGVYVWSCASSH